MLLRLIADASTNEDSAYSLLIHQMFSQMLTVTDSCAYNYLPSSGTLSMVSSGTLSGTPTQRDVDAHIQLSNL